MQALQTKLQVKAAAEGIPNPHGSSKPLDAVTAVICCWCHQPRYQPNVNPNYIHVIEKDKRANTRIKYNGGDQSCWHPIQHTAVACSCPTSTSLALMNLMSDDKCRLVI